MKNLPTTRKGAAGIHFCISAAIAAAVALLIFWLWYPYPYSALSGGRELFTIVIGVDIVLGPLLTLIIYDRRKPWAELRRDLLFIAMLQLTGLAYGVWTLAEARPVHMVFEIDRFRAIHATDVPRDLLHKAAPGVDTMPLLGPTLLAVRPFRSSEESTEATIAALKGLHIGVRPDLWAPYSQGLEMLQKAAKPVAVLKSRFPARAQEIDRLLTTANRTESQTVWVPLVGRKSFWTVFVDPATGAVVGYLPLDSF